MGTGCTAMKHPVPDRVERQDAL